MIEKEFDINKERNTFYGWFVIRAITNNKNKEGNEKMFESIKNNDGLLPKITMQINGFDIDPEEALKSLGEVFDEQVKKEAEILIKDKVFEDLDKMTSLFNEVEKSLKEKLLSKLDIKLKGDY